MPDFLGNIAVPEIIPVGTFPLTPDFGHAEEIAPHIAVHQFGSGDAKIEQRFYLGTGARRFFVRRAKLYETDRQALRDFWEARRGPYGAFTYNRPNEDQNGTTAHTCRFENEPLSWEMLGVAVSSTGVTLVEIPSTSPTYPLNDTVTRFPSALLRASLLEQVQEIIPLVKLQPRQPSYPAIYLSDRRVSIGGFGSQLYLPRLLDFEGISQSMGNESDEARFIFGNADRAMRDLANDVDLFRASLEFSLFHVGTGIKIDLWKGDVIDYSIDAGPEFPLTAADGLYELNLPYPTRKVSRVCGKDFNDGLACPFATDGALDLGHFPSGSGASCDKGYETANGCLAHGMKRFFGGITAEPQGVRIKDNSTGRWGIGRASLNSVSLVSESIFDEVVPEIYTDSDMPVTCMIASGRDESDFYDALGIVGEGPLTFGKGHKLDGSYNHGYPGPFGLREVAGTDPAGTVDYFSLGQVGDQTAGNFRKAFDGVNTYSDNFSAGTAFLELRRSDEKGLQLSRPGDHSMQAIVKGGLQGWAWTAPGVRSQVTLTNPIWIIVNMILRANGARFADEATAEEYFDVDAAIAAAAICDLTVDKIVGTGTETQFVYRTVLKAENPLRDWVQELLKGCLGYYTFAFGKLKLGIRVNSSTVEAFTTGNIVFNSLRLEPVKPTFNHLTANFADEELEFANYGLPFYDIDHAKIIGSSTNPLYLKSTIDIPGCYRKSHAARIIAVRVREELGGVNAAQWKAARRIAFKTTALALNVEPGMICSMTHPDMPGASTLGEFRVLGWRLNKDYSIDVEGKTTTDQMYDLVAGPKPADVAASPFPHTIRDLLPRPPFGWLPFWESAGTDDPIYAESDFSFGLKPQYEDLADGTSAARLLVKGKLTVNTLSSIRQPILSKDVTSTSGGGAIPGGFRYYFVVCARDGDGLYTQSSEVVGVDIPIDADPSSITLTIDALPDGAPGGFVVFGGIHRDRLSAQLDTLTEPTVFPFSFTLTGPFVVNGWGVPDGEFDRLRFKLKKVLHAGVFGQQVGAVTSGSITVAGGDFDAGQWTDYIVSVLGLWTPNVVSDAGGSASTFLGAGLDDLLVTEAGNGDRAIFEVQIQTVGTPDIFQWRKDGGAWNTGNAITGAEQSLSDGVAIVFASTTGHTANDTWQIPIAGFLPILNYRVASNDSDKLTLASGDPLADGVKVGDVIVMRHRPTIVTETSIGDPNVINSFNPSGATNDETGNLIRILAGTGAGQLRKILSNTTTEWEVDRAWDTLPDESSIFIVEKPEWETRTESTPIDVIDPNQDVSLVVNAENLAHQIVLVQAVSIDGGSHEAPDEDCPAREVYLFGLPGRGVRDYSKRFVIGDETIATGSDVMQNNGVDLFDSELVAQYTEWKSTVKDAPSGDDLVVAIYYSEDSGANWTELVTVTTLDGASEASGSFPVAVTVHRETIYKADVTNIGSTTAGGRWECTIKGRLAQL